MSREQIDDPAWNGSNAYFTHAVERLFGAIGDAFCILTRAQFEAPWRREAACPPRERKIP